MSIERVKEVEEYMQDQLDINFYAIKKEDARFLIDTVKQQNEKIDQLTHFLSVSNELVDFKNKEIDKILEDNKRLQNLVQSLTEKNQSLGERDADAANH